MLECVHGKPGSGKSCFVVAQIVKRLEDWVRYELKEGEPYPRLLYTNVPLDVDAINAYLSERLCRKDIEAGKYINVVDFSFFRSENGDYRQWWDDFPEGALIVIDEVHHFLPANLKGDKGGKDFAAAFVNYISMHRHKQHDLIFLTQHLNNITAEVKRMAETIYEVLNIKNQTIGIWPFKVKMSDIDIVRESWGCPVQMAHIKRGICTANTVEYEKVFEQFFLTPALFKLYRSHTNSSESSDRPSLHLGKVGSLVWLARQYFFRFAMWAVVLITALYTVKNTIENIPTILQKSLVPGSVSDLPGNSSSDPAASPQVHSAELEHSAVIPTPQNTAGDDVILGFVRNGVITKKGILRQDDHILINGEKDFVKNVDVMRGILYLGSGKKVQK